MEILPSAKVDNLSAIIIGPEGAVEGGGIIPTPFIIILATITTFLRILIIAATVAINAAILINIDKTVSINACSFSNDF